MICMRSSPDAFPTDGEGGEEKVRTELRVLLAEARKVFKQRNLRKTVDALHQAQGAATQGGLHREAAQIQRALTILSTGGRPKLLVQENRELGDP